LAERINKKVALGSYGYLKINPSSVRMGKMNYNHDTLQAVLGISCFPELHSDSTNNYSASFLPPLQSADRPAGITLYTNAHYSYDFINHLLNNLIKDTSFTVEGRTITLKNVQVAGQDNGKLELRVDFAGDKKGTLYLTGTPHLDTATQIITMPDLDYTLKSRDLVLNMGKTLFSNKILHALQAKSTFNIREMIDHNRPAINAQLNKKIMDGVLTTGTLTDLKVLALIVGKDLLRAQTRTTASAAVIITKL
ncbi:MAG: DUF4403 family protein, partial [Bacteroidetes bacterium]|nr:DUF4403 family protein [Bacteroidota bacterium]